MEESEPLEENKPRKPRVIIKKKFCQNCGIDLGAFELKWCAKCRKEVNDQRRIDARQGRKERVESCIPEEYRKLPDSIYFNPWRDVRDELMSTMIYKPVDTVDRLANIDIITIPFFKEKTL